uniref:DUF3310 domain-containing protein n=1 Tax=Anaerovibrio slackiae TaxID=2652309 RepID=UPI0038707C85
MKKILQEAAEKLIRNCDGRTCTECYFFHRNHCGFGTSPLNWEVLGSQENEKQAVATDNVNHPKHYQMAGGIEVIYMIANVLGPTGLVNYCWGNAIKYICRWREKGGVESLDKAIWYINMMRDVA